MKRPIFGALASEVFTPRKHSVNPKMYVHRPNLEQKLLRAARGAKHFCIFGESGNGKSWLYKHVFESNRIDYTTLNLSKAVVLGSVLEAIKDKVQKKDGELREISTTRTGSINPGGLGVTTSTASKKVYHNADPISQLFRDIKGTKRFPSVVVFDNFEMIIGKPDLIEELSNLIVMLDDNDYGEFNVRFCFVGVPAEIREYIAQQSHRATIMTRLAEIDEVSRMKPEQAKQILQGGFERELRLKFQEPEKKDEIYNQLISVSDRIATEIQALGLHVSMAAQENDNIIEELVVADAIKSWLAESHSAAQQTISERLNSEGNGRRSQVLYCLGRCQTENFTAAEIGELFTEMFGLSSTGRPVDVSKILSALSKGENAPLSKNRSFDGYRFANPKFRMAIRGMLVKEGDRVSIPQVKI